MVFNGYIFGEVKLYSVAYSVGYSVAYTVGSSIAVQICTEVYSVLQRRATL